MTAPGTFVGREGRQTIKPCAPLSRNTLREGQEGRNTKTNLDDFKTLHRTWPMSGALSRASVLPPALVLYSQVFAFKNIVHDTAEKILYFRQPLERNLDLQFN